MDGDTMSRRKFVSLRTRIILFFGITVLFTNLFVGFFSYKSAEKELSESTKIMLRNSAKTVIDLIDDKNAEVELGYIPLEVAQESVKEFILGPLQEDGTRPLNANIDLGINGYIFILDSQGFQIAHPVIEGQNSWHLADQLDSDFYVSRSIISKAINGGGFTYYNWDFPHSEEISSKLVYSELANEWGWIVCSSIYLDDFSEGAQDIFKFLTLSTSTMFIFAFMGVFLFSDATIRPIHELVNAIESISDTNYTIPNIKRSSDEIGLLYNAFINMLDRLNREHDIREATEEELKTVNAQLKELIEDRTKKLESSLEELTLAQNHLVESERLAALGTLVAGIAHEVNTPLGIGVTTVSHLNMINDKALTQLTQNKMSAEDLKNYFIKVDENISILYHNLYRAAELVNSFKEVAVDQNAIALMKFNVKAYLDKILLSLKHEYKHTNHKIDIFCDESLYAYTYPGALSQILTNLIMNSLIHGFENIDKGHIEIQFDEIGDSYHLLYRDNGRGIGKANLEKIFRPFFTTKRDSGGSGLGLHIIYTIVTQQLNGTINLESEIDQGIEILIRFPVLRRGEQNE